MNWKKALIRNLLFAVLCAAAGFYCTGCCWGMTERTWDRLGSEKTVITNRHYEYSPDRGEIVFSGKKKTKHYVWPFIAAFNVSWNTWNTYKPFEKRIPLEPVPENLIRLDLEALPDSAALRARNLLGDWMPGENQFDNYVTLIREGTVLRRTNAYYIRPGDTLSMSVHPDDLPVLSKPCVIHLDGPISPSSGPDHWKNPDILPDYQKWLLLFPYAQDGVHYEMLTLNADSRNLSAFAEEFERETAQDNRDPIGPLGWCWKVLWIPSAVVTDILITTPLAYYAGFYMLYIFGKSIQ